MGIIADLFDGMSGMCYQNDKEKSWDEVWIKGKVKANDTPFTAGLRKHMKETNIAPSKWHSSCLLDEFSRFTREWNLKIDNKRACVDDRLKEKAERVLDLILIHLETTNDKPTP